MKIINIRSGFATNSSSSHSVIYMSDINSPELNDFYHEEGYFGQNDFLQRSKEEKMKYICLSTKRSFESPEKMAEYFNMPIESFIDTYNNGYIDHESYGLIYNPEEALFVLNNDHFFITGGCDDDNTESQISSSINMDIISFVKKQYDKMLSENKNRLVTNKYNDILICESNGIATYFNKENGRKIRFNMNNDLEKYLSVPELVDIKITDYCPFGCEYCYQDSTTSGQHADFKTLKSIIDDMKENGVFELAIGGGEPTLYPYFRDMLEYCNNSSSINSIVPNFTTRNIKVFNDYNIIDLIGGFAYSISDIKDLDKFFSYLEDLDYDEATKIVNKASIQIVLGSMSRIEYNNIIDYILMSFNKIKDNDTINCDSKLTIMLLGYKTTGRGTKPDYDYTENALSDIVNKAKFCRGISIGIDTAAAIQLEVDINKNNIKNDTYYTKEGVASCYIDAVNNKIASSSYCPEIESNTMDEYSKDTFIDNFKKYQNKGMNKICIYDVDI